MNPVQYKEEWKRPFTNKRYLHPPFAENMFTMWPDMKVICGDIIEITRGYISAGFRILIGEDLISPDFTKVSYKTRDDGAPLHSLSQNFGSYSIDMESFCSIERCPTAFTKFTIKNNTSERLSETVALLPRTGREDHLVGTEVDAYTHYDSNVHNWGMLPSNWRLEGNLLRDGTYTILTQKSDNITLEWQGDVKGLVWYKRHLLKLNFTLNAGESATFICSLKSGEASPFDYALEREKALSFWNGELGRIKKYPGLKEHKSLVNNLVMQLLQMFSIPKDKDYVLTRQGGMQRVIWPNEAVEFLVALDRYGDFWDYTERAYDTYFFQLQKKEGEDMGAVQNLSGNFWGSITAAACYGCGNHLIYRNSKKKFEKFADSLYLAFNWMQLQRSKTKYGKYEGVGLFPPMKATDWPDVGQIILTDCVNIMGYEALAAVFEHFGDERGAEIRAAHREYIECARRSVEKQVAENKREDEILLTVSIGVEMPDPPCGAYAGDGPMWYARAGVLEPNGEVMKLVENYYRNRGLMKNGLTGLMNDGLIFQGHNADPWAGHSWYTSFGDLAWFINWLKGGDRAKAEETLLAQIKWGMSPEFYMLERYADNDPYWTPWMPNASANGRLLMMLGDFYGKGSEV